MAQASSSPAAVDTAKVAGRRMLRFESIDQAIAEADRLAEADRAGCLKRLGNWTQGQALGHLATWTEYGYTGAPMQAPLFVKLLVRPFKRKYLYGPMRPGVKIPRIDGGTLAFDPMTTDEGFERFRRAMTRLKSEAPTYPSQLFGMLKHDEAVALNLRHAELHLSFFVPE